MALRSETAALGLALVAALPVAAQQVWEWPVGHIHSPMKDCMGLLHVDENGVRYRQLVKEGKNPRHQFKWTWTDIQELTLSETNLTIVTYKDRIWLAGSDQPFRFKLPSNARVWEVVPTLRQKLPQRFVPQLAVKPELEFWRLPAKRLGRFKGEQGWLIVGQDRITFESNEPGASRSWNLEDIDSISRQGSYRLVIVTSERSLKSYGDRRAFEFQLKEPLAEAPYDALWLRIQETKGMNRVSTKGRD